jgi:type I restriction enzyme R subunit
MKADTTEKGLETLIMRHLTGTDGLASGSAGMWAEVAPATGGTGWFAGSDSAYDREFAVDVAQLFTFLIATQPDEWANLGIGSNRDSGGMARQKFLARTERGVALRQEYRTRMTAGLVTGKVYVREAAAHLPAPPVAEEEIETEDEPMKEE